MLCLGWLAECPPVRAQSTGPGGGTVVSPGGGSVGGPGGGGTAPTTGGSTGGGPIGPGGDGGSPTVIGPGGGATVTEPTLAVPRGVLLGETVIATVRLPTTTAGSDAPTYQWAVSGAQGGADARSSTFEFTANRAGTVTLAVNGTYNGTTFSLNASVTVLSGESAGRIAVAERVPTGAATATAAVPPAQNGDRTFRWSISGDAVILSGQNAANVSFRPGSPGPKELVCAVNLQNLVTINLRAVVNVAGDGAPVAVTVTNGSGGGNWTGGSRAEVFAWPPAAGQVFDRWTGDTGMLGELDATALRSMRLSFTVPTRPVQLTATYRNVASWTPTVVTAFGGAGATLSYHFPEAARGSVFLLHDRGETGAAWFDKPEALLLVRDLVAAGYGIAALTCVDRSATGTWATASTFEGNADLRNHAAALDRFVAERRITAGGPIFLVGNGAGGVAAEHFAHLLAGGSNPRPVRGAVLLGNTGSETWALTGRVPRLYVGSGPDDGVVPGGANSGRTLVQLLLGRGVAADTWTVTRSPVWADRFRGLAVTRPEFTVADAGSVWSALRSAEWLDANSHVVGTPDADDVAAALPAVLRGRAKDVAALLTLGRGGVEIASETAPRLLAFLDARLAGGAAPEPGRMVNLSVRTALGFVGDTFMLGFNLAGSERATVLVRGIGPGLAHFGAATPLPALRLEVRRGATLLEANESWEEHPARGRIEVAAASVGAFPLRAGDRDASLLLELEPGSHTVTLAGNNGADGECLVEVYDVSRSGTRLVNLSALGRIQTEGDMLVPGVVVAGSGPRTVVVRAVGPGLASVGVDASGVLGDPRLAVLGGNGATVRSNQNWDVGGGAALAAVFPVVGAFPLRAQSADAALVAALTPGNYTMQVAGTTAPANAAGAAASATPANPTGQVLVEVYEVP